MGFLKENYSNDKVGLVVIFGRGESSPTYFNGDSVEEAIKYFNLYLKNNELYAKTENELAVNSLGINPNEAVDFRNSVDSILKNLTDEQALNSPVLFPIWKNKTEYKANDRIRYEDKLYKVLQAHTSQEDWIPSQTPSLFALLLINEETNEILNWIQPDSTNGYSIGDKVLYDGTIYESLIDNNVWSPEEYPEGWFKISEE